MKYIKMLGALGMCLFMSAPGSASATSVTSSLGTTPVIVASSSNAKIDGSFVTVECSNSELISPVESHGFAVPLTASVTKLIFEKCNYAVTTKNNGTLAVEGVEQTGNGTVKSLSAQVAIHTSVGECTFSTLALTGTDIGELTGSNNTGGRAVLDINSAKLSRTGGNFLCGSSATWTGNYTVQLPSNLEVH